MQKFNILGNSKLFFSKHSTTIKVVGSICGAAIIAVSASNYCADETLSFDEQRKILESNINGQKNPLVDKVIIGIKQEYKNGIYEHEPVYEYGVIAEKTDDSKIMVPISMLTQVPDLKTQDVLLEVKQVMTGIDEEGNDIYKQQVAYETGYLVYNEDGTKVYRGKTYLQKYVTSIEIEDKKAYTK